MQPLPQSVLEHLEDHLKNKPQTLCYFLPTPQPYAATDLLPASTDFPALDIAYE